MKWLERRILGKTVEQLLSVTLALVALGSLVYWIPIWQTRDLVGPLQSQEVLELQNKLRATWAQVLGGGLLLIGLYFTWKQVQIAREHQITERFTRAVDQLGSEKLEIRLGGIYALERIARDSEKDHWPIMEILTTFIRVHARWTDEDQALSQQDKDHGEASWTNCALPVADIQAVLNVVGCRSPAFREKETRRLDLIGVNLRKAIFAGGYWCKTDFQGAGLEAARFRGTDLTYADFTGAYLEDTDMRGVVLREAVLKTRLLRTDFRESADLREVQALDPKRLDEALGDSSTLLPHGVNRPSHWLTAAK